VFNISQERLKDAALVAIFVVVTIIVAQKLGLGKILYPHTAPQQYTAPRQDMREGRIGIG
jgi:hypothetical protein